MLSIIYPLSQPANLAKKYSSNLLLISFLLKHKMHFLLASPKKLSDFEGIPEQVIVYSYISKTSTLLPHPYQQLFPFPYIF